MSKLYFGADVDQSIVLFQLEDDIDRKNEIFVKDIKPAFEKLINYHYHRMPVIKDDEIQYDCLSFLYEQIDKFNTEKHKRGFPYFNVIVKHFFIQRLKNENKKKATDKNTDSISEYDKNRTYFDENLMVEDLDTEYENKEFFILLKEQIPKWKKQFTKPQEKEFIDAITYLIDNIDNIDIFNKKAIYFYLKEITNLNSKQISINLIKMRRKFLLFKKKYDKGNI